MTTLVIRVKRSRVRKPPAPRTCCPSHPDRCKFGHQHVWAGPFYERDEYGTHTWRDDGAYKCAACGAVCVAEVGS